MAESSVQGLMMATMATYQTRAARRTRTASTRAIITNLIAEMHALFTQIILDPTDEKPFHRVDDICQEIWQECIMHQMEPWQFCLDRYCSCKVALSEWEPERLPFRIR